MTTYEKIKNMTPIELARFLEEVQMATEVHGVIRKAYEWRDWLLEEEDTDE